MYTEFFLNKNAKFLCISCGAYDITVKNRICEWCILGYYPEHDRIEVTIDNTANFIENDAAVLQERNS